MNYWPTSADYSRALQNPQTAFADAGLMTCTIERDRNRQPLPRSGAFASVYRATYNGTNRDVGIRVFNHRVEERRERYEAISLYLKTRQLNCLVEFEYLEKGIRVPDSKGLLRSFSMIKMDWVEGLTLFDWTRNQCAARNTQSLLQACDRWVDLVNELANAQIVHGDLQHGNVMVTPNGELKLVDYDCMCVPALIGQLNPELGVEPYQHPKRDANTKLFLGLDNFSAVFIYTALRALALQPELWQMYVEPTNDNAYDKLLFRREDFDDPNESPLYNVLMQSSDPRLKQLVDDLFGLVKVPLDSVPSLSQFAKEIVPNLTDTTLKLTPPSLHLQSIDKLNPFAWHARRREEAVLARTCPRCLAVGKMIYDADESRLWGERVLRCCHIIRDDLGESCDFVFPERLMRLPRINITTLGPACNGETVWVSSVYRILRSPELQPHLPSGTLVYSDACDEYELFDRRLREARIRPSATVVPSLQTPLVFHVSGLDHGVGEFLTLIFAPCVGNKGLYCGRDVGDPLVNRQLQTNGMIWFVDPLYSRDANEESLVRLRTCIGELKDHAPQLQIAVCMTKIDLLIAKTRDSGLDQKLLAEFSAELFKIQKITIPGSAQRVNACAQWTRSMCRMLWPRWNIDEQLQAICGDRFEFFPVSAIGIADVNRADLDMNSLEERTIEPFGVVEPLLWLIHANGYRVWQTTS